MTLDDARGPATGALVAAVTIYLGFNAGGFFPDSIGTATVVLCVAAVLGIMLVGRPFGNFSPSLLIGIALLTAFAVLTLVSGSWSGANGRALLEFNRVLFYLVALLLFGMLGPGGNKLAWGLGGFLLAAFVLCGAGWITRVAPDVWPIAPDVQPGRLSFPLTYWNALGLMACLAIISAAHFSAWEGGNRLVRSLGAAAIPILASVLLLTFSRAALGLLPVGLLLYAILAGPKRTLTTLIAGLVPAVVALLATYGSEKVSSAHFMTPAAVAEGHHLAILMIVCAVVAAVARWFLAPLDRRLERWHPAAGVDPRRLRLAVAGGAVVVLGLALALGGASWIHHQYDNFVNGNVVGHIENPRERLTSTGNNGRLAQWEVAVESFERKPALGNGAGTYQNLWAIHRPHRYVVLQAHSLYLGLMAELGIVGLLLVVGMLVAILVGVARRLRGSQRGLSAALLAMLAVWVVHAGVDWDWEMPAVTFWIFALSGLCLSRPVVSRPETGSEPPRFVRLVGALVAGVLAVTPVAAVLSQTRLDAAVAAFERGDCRAAIDDSLGSLEALNVRPEPYEISGYCDARAGQYQLAISQMETAVSRDPENWETHYGLAIVLAAAGHDPMPELAEAHRLNPLNEVVTSTQRYMRGGDPETWRRRARMARLPE